MKPLSFDTVEQDARRVAVTNGAGSACPAFGLARPTGGGDGATWTVGQPNADGGFAWVNGPFEIAAGGGGAVHATGPFYALYDSGDGTPAVGEMWGAGNGSWKLKKNKAGFRVVGDPDTTVTLVPVERVSLSSPLTTKGDLWGFDTTDARIPVGTNTYVLTADSAETLGVKWSAVAGSGLVDGDYGDITVSAAATTWTIDNGVVTDAKFRDSAALSVVGRSANSSGAVADIAAGTDAYVLRRSGTSLGFGQVATGGITDAAVTDAKLRDSAALSVIGRSANSTGVPADIAAASDDYVLRRSGSALAFGRVATGGITDSAVTYAKIQSVSATNRILGRVTSGAGVVEELTAANVLVILGYPSGTTAVGPAWIKVTVDYTDIATAATTADPVVLSLPAGAIIHHTVARCTTAWAGGSISDANMTGVGLVNGGGGENRYLPSVTVFSATFTAGSGASVNSLNTPESFSGATDIYAHFGVTGDNLDQATQGSVDIWFLVSQLP